jgi:glycosyltransferase involved in cell wall biosynthesis
VDTLTNLKIALISEEFPPHIHGGTGTFCYSLATWLSNRKIDTTVFTGRSKTIERQRLNDHLEVIRLPIFDLPPRYFWFQLQNLSTLLRSLERFSVLHSITPEISPLCVFLKNRLNKPLITSYHGYTSYEMKAFIDSPFLQSSLSDFGFNVLEYPLYDAANRLSLAKSDRIICCSYTILNELKTIYKRLDLNKASVIYNGIDMNEFQKVRIENKEIIQKPTLLFFGRWFWSKGIPYLLEAFTSLSKMYPELQLEICGKGPMEDKIKQSISDSGLQDNVHLLGHVSRKTLLESMAKADVIVLPSLREAQPISVLEAMASRKPVVVFDLPFAKEYIKDSYNGLLAKPKDAVDLANKISALLSDSQLRKSLSTNAFNHVVDQHNWNKLIDDYISVYDQVSS